MPCCCSFLLYSLLALSLCKVSFAVLVGDLLSLLVFAPVLLLSFLFPEVPKVPGQFFSCLFEFFLQFCYPVVLLFFSSDSRILFLVGVFLDPCAKFLFLFLLLIMLLLLFRSPSSVFSPVGLEGLASLSRFLGGIFLFHLFLSSLFLFLRFWRQ